MSSIRPDPNLLKKYPNAITLQQIEERDRFAGTLLGAAAGESHHVDRMLALLGSLVARRRFDQADVARRYLEWFEKGPKAVGKLTRAALENLRAGDGPEQASALAWEDSGRKAAGNGSVLFGAPIGLLHVRRLEGLADDGAGASRITHCDPRCIGGCVAVATATALLVRGGTDADEAVARAADAAGAISDDVRVSIERGVSRRPEEIAVDGKGRGYVLRTVEIAFSALASATSFEEGVVAVVARGGDTGTNGAVAGALLGAKFGKRAIPQRGWTASPPPRSSPRWRNSSTRSSERNGQPAP